MTIDSFASVEELLPSRGALLGARISSHTSFAIGAGVMVVIFAVALLAPWLAPHVPFAQDLGRRLIPPDWHDGGSWTHVLGTDQLGRDYLSRLIYGSRISLLIGATAKMTSMTPAPIAKLV